MSDKTNHVFEQTQVPPDAFEYTDLPPEKAGTRADRRDMARLGKTQEFKRNFHFISIFGFSAVLMITWEGVFNSVSYTINNGGLPSMVWMYLVVLFGFGAAILSMAEMASIAPTSGGQYHWISEFAPKSVQKILSYIAGWYCVLGWQAGIAGQCFTIALQIQGLITLNKASYVTEPWHAVLLTIATAVCAVIFNSYFARHLPLLEGLVLILHVCGFFAILIPLWVFAPRSTSSQVWTEFQVTSGWQSTGVACLVGLTGPLYALMGPDSAVHMSEEVHDASRTLPWAMVSTLILNGVSGFIMVVTFAYCLGPIQQEPEFNFQFIGTFFNATGSHAGATIMTLIITVLTFFSAISNVATASRQLFAFARDDGVPFASVWRHIHPGWDIPLNAILFSFMVTALLSLINLGSIVAFNAILSIGVVALLSSYLISLTCTLLLRMEGRMPPNRWSLGSRLGFACNIVGLAFLVIAFIFAFFPLGTPVTASTMNWAAVVYGGVFVTSIVFYIFVARKTYVPPVARLAKDL